MTDTLQGFPIGNGTAGEIGIMRPGIVQAATPLLITTTPFTVDATPDAHRVYAVALAAPALLVDVKLPANPLDGATVTVKGDATAAFAGGTPMTVSAADGKVIDAGGQVLISMPPTAAGPVGQARTFTYFDALGEWRVTWSFPGNLVPPP